MVQLQQQIAAAEAAAARVAELEAVKQQADALPALKQQLAAQQWIAQALPAAEQAERQAAAILADVTPKMVAWRERLEALYSELHEHVAALPTIQSEISTAARFARTAAGYRQGIAQHTGPGRIASSRDWAWLYNSLLLMAGWAPSVSTPSHWAMPA